MFDVDQLRLQIEELMREFPELADDEVLRVDMLDGATDIKDVLGKLFRSADHDKDDIDVLTAQIQRRSARRARLAQRVETLRGLMLKVLQSADLKRITLPEVTLTQVRGTPQLLPGEIDGDTLPDDLVRIKREPDRAMIRQALLDGREVPGCSLSNAAPTLMMRGK